MYFIEFPISSTNIFPLANSNAGGQLLSEYNLRSRETVATDPNVKYPIGPSYTHSLDDFDILSQANGADISSTSIQINPGRALVNGHYVELLTPIVIDLAAVNYNANQNNVDILKGDLAIGLVMMYSNYPTLAGSALVENEEGYYDGVRVVIVPELSVKLPSDVPGENQYSEVNMHLLLGKFSFYSGTVSNVSRNNSKVQILDASRVGNISSSVSDIYVSKAGMDKHHLYIFADKRNSDTDPKQDTWCAAEDSLMVWDTNPTLKKDNPHSAYVAHFEYNYDPNNYYGHTGLVLPHKQIDGAVDQQGNPVYYPDRFYPIPNATFAENSGGAVSPEYTKRVKHIEYMTNNLYRLPNGKMREYIDTLTSIDDLPPIPIEDGSVEMPDIDEIVSSINSLLESVSSDLSGSGSIIELLTTSIERLSGDPSVRTTLISANNNIEETSNQISGSSPYCVNMINAAIDLIDRPSPTHEQLQEAISDLTNVLNGYGNNGFPRMIQWLSTADAKLDFAIRELNDSSSGTITNNLISAKNKATSCVTNLNKAIAKVSGMKSSIEDYIRAEVEKRVDSQSILTSSYWSPGDYVLVRSDETQTDIYNKSGVWPSTLYIVNYGTVTAIAYVSEISAVFDTNESSYAFDRNVYMHKVPPVLSGGVELDAYIDSKELDDWGSDEPSAPTVDIFGDLSIYHGCINHDYFVARYCYKIKNTHQERIYSFFYKVTKTNLVLEYCNPPLLVTGGVPLATNTSIGGFISVPEDETGQGYVRIDENGRLRVVDYNYLVLGMEAQQLGHDLEIGSGMDIATINQNLEEFVNDRICYPNAAQIQDASSRADGRSPDPHVIYLDITVPTTTEESIIHIHDIGSRSDSYLYVSILGTPTSATTIIFENCEKIRINDTIGGSPNIILKNVNLYYNSNVLDKASTVYEMKLWYERDRIYTDVSNNEWYPDPSSPDLQLDGMTVTLVGDIENTMTYDPWTLQNPNDNHYMYALRSVTFASDASIIGMCLLVSDATTANIDEGTSLFRSSFTVPQNSGLSYPPSKMTHQLKVSGSFVTCYWDDSSSKYILKETDFSALSQKYVDAATTNVGSIAFCTDVSRVSHVVGVADADPIDCWEAGSLHAFFGASID